ncbi:hypothetical protein EC991_009526, partial [Linnemannia zychae]
MDHYSTAPTATTPNSSSADGEISSSLASSQQQSVLGGSGFRVSLRSLGILGPVTSQTATRPHHPKTPPHSPTLYATAPVHPRTPAATDAVSSPPQQKQRRMSICQGLVKDKESRGSSPTGSPSTSKLTSKGWASKIGFLNPKRKSSLPLQSHYLSLPVGGTATSPTGMYMLHSEDLSVTEFAKLAGITILQEEDDPTTFEESQVNIGNEVHVHRRGSSAELSVAAAAAGGCVLDCTTPGTLGGSAGNTLTSERNLTVGSDGSDRGGSRKTNIWDPQFWADPVRDGATSQLLLPSASTSSLPITSGSGLLAPRPFQNSVGNSAPNSPRLRPQSSLPSSGLSSGVSSSTPSFTQTATTAAKLSPTSAAATNPSEVPFQRRRNSCSPALIPAAGSKPGSDVDRTRHCTSSGVPLKRADQLPRPPTDAIHISQDLGRRRSFTSLTAVALELESGDKGKGGVVSATERGIGSQEGSHAGYMLPDHVNTTASTPHVHLEPSTPTKSTPIAPPGPSMSHTLAMHALHTPRSRGSVSGISRTRSPSPSPLSRQIDLESLESSHEDESGSFEEKDASLAYLSPPLAPPASRNSRQSFSHSNTGMEHASKYLSVNTSAGPMAQPRAQTLPPSITDQQLNHTQKPPRIPPRPQSTSVTPSPSRSLTPSSSSRPTTPSPGRTFTPGTKVGRFTLVQERCTKHVDLLQAQQAQRRASLGELKTTRGGIASTSTSSTSLAREDSAAVLDTTEWVDNPTLKPEDNVRVFQRKRSR